MNFKFNNQKDYFFYDVNITFETGKIYFIQGKNGVGKSTFFSILQGITPSYAELQGCIAFNNTQYPISNNIMNANLCVYVKTMLQDSNKMVALPLTVRENLALAQLPYHPTLEPLSLECNITILDNFSINPEATVQQLSGGQRQILAILMILQKPTQVLLLDEPTAALDDKNSHMVMDFLDRLVKELDIMVIIITHDKELIEIYSEHPKITIKKDSMERRTIEY